MDKQVNKIKWLWLEEQPSTVNYISKQIIQPFGIEYEMYRTVPSLVQRMTEISNSKTEVLQQFGLILDVYLRGTNFLTLPKSWSQQEDENIPTNFGYDAGLVFYETFILGYLPHLSESRIVKPMPYWAPPPPVIFLTVVDADSRDMKERISDIKNKWIQASNIQGASLNDAKVEYIKKFDLDKSKLSDLYAKWVLQ